MLPYLQFNYHIRSVQKSVSQQNRETPSSSKSKGLNSPYSQVSLQSASASNLMKYQNLNSGSKPIQPILRQKEETKMTSQQLALKKSNSGPMEKKVKQGSADSKVQSNQKVMKEQTFNYQEQAPQQNEGSNLNSDGTPNRQLFKKSTNDNKIQNQNSKSKMQQLQQYDDEVIEVIQQDQDFEVNPRIPNDRSLQSYKKDRPSDEVQYQEILMDDRDLASSLGASLIKNSQLFQEKQSISRFQPEANEAIYPQSLKGNQFKRDNQYKNINHMKVDESGFKVHEESYRGSAQEEDRLMQLDERLAQSRSPNEVSYVNYDVPSNWNKDQSNNKDKNRNSDLRKFNIDEELQNQQQLRQIRKQEDEQRERVSKSPNVLSEESRNNSPRLQGKTQGQVYEQKYQKGNQFVNQQQEQDYYSSMSPINNYQSPQTQQSSEDKDPRFREHILSFADKNQLYLEYPPLQINQHEHEYPEVADHNAFRPLSPSAAKQQQRLQDILKSSKGDVSQLKNVLQSQKIDEQSLNSMIDMEKNYVIMQYEGILQQLNIEFHKMLSKNKEMSEQMTSKENFIKTQSVMIQDKEELIFQQEQVILHLKNQLQDQFQESKQNSQKHIASELDNLRLDKELQDQKIHTQQSQLRQFQNVEEDLREQIESLQGRLRSSEQQLRVKEEEQYGSDRDKQRLIRDIKNLGDIEAQLKEEIKLATASRLKTEDLIQVEKQKCFQSEVMKKQREMELENQIRDNRSLKGTVEILQKNQNEIIFENNALKEQITQFEKERLNTRQVVEQNQNQVKLMRDELKNTQMQLQKQRELNESMTYEKKSDYPKAQGPPYQGYNTSNKEQIYERHQFKESKLNQTHSQFDTEYSSKPLQENNQNYYSPQRNQRFQQQPFSQSQNPPPSTHNQSMSNNGNDSQSNVAIPWMSQGSQNYMGGQQDQRSRQRHDDFKQQNQSMSQKRKTHGNQHDSSLQEFFQWPSQNQQSQQPNQIGNARSLERQNKSSYIQLQPNQMPLPQESVWNKDRTPLGQYAQNITPTNQHQLKQQDQELPAAGKKSTLKMGQSPLEKKNVNLEQQMLHMQNSLSALQQDKEMVFNIGQSFRLRMSSGDWVPIQKTNSRYRRRQSWRWRWRLQIRTYRH